MFAILWLALTLAGAVAFPRALRALGARVRRGAADDLRDSWEDRLTIRTGQALLGASGVTGVLLALSS